MIQNHLTTVQAKDKKHLAILIRKAIKQHGPKADLNFIDTSQITDMDGLFGEPNFNGDISGWDMSNVTQTNSMFDRGSFNRDVSSWGMSKVKKMDQMFYGSPFNGDISQWYVPNLESARFMFHHCPFNGDISIWNIRNVPDYEKKNSVFCQDMSLEGYHQYWTQRQQLIQTAQQSLPPPSNVLKLNVL